MSIFGKIMSAIFGTHPASAAPAGGAGAPAGGAAGGAAAAPASGGYAAQSVDVAPIVDKARSLAREAGMAHLDRRPDEGVGLDSSLAARKELAKELGYTGDTNNSASMNVWLHQQVMAKLAANGGKLPPEIKH